MASKAGAKKCSIVWDFFEAEKDSNKAKCKICKVLIGRGGQIEAHYTTSNMKKHLQTQHKDTYVEKETLLQNEKKRHQGQEHNPLGFKKLKTQISNICLVNKNIETASTSQLTIQETLNLKQKWDINNVKSRKLHYLIAEMIAVDNQPFSIVNDIGFIRFVNEVAPNYTIPSTKYISQNILPNIYTAMKKEVKNIIDNTEAISFTTDIWSTHEKSFISLTGHCIDQNFEQNIIVLAVTPFEESHTGTNIKNLIIKCLTTFEIPNSKVHMIARDNGANMVKGINESGFKSLSCFLHTLQLVIHDSILEQRVVKDILANCRRIVKHFNHSTLAYTKLKEFQKNFNLPEHKLMQDVPTRWNSSYLLLERLLEQRQAVTHYCCSATESLPLLDGHKWSIIEGLVLLLELFHRFTQILGHRKALASEIIPYIRLLKHNIRKEERKNKFNGILSTVEAIKASMNIRLSSYCNNKDLILATYLDPRFKSTIFEDTDSVNSPRNIKKIESYIIEILKELEDDNNNESLDTSTSSTSEGVTEEGNQRTSVWGTFFKDIAIPNNEESAPNSQSKSSKREKDIKAEIIKYSSLESVEMIENDHDSAIIWWKLNQKTFPLLVKLAKRYLSCPPSSIESERLFSIGGNIYTNKRNKLNPDNGEMLMFLHHNLRLFNFKYEKV